MKLLKTQLLLVALLLVQSAFGQATGSISGLVTNQNGEAQIGAHIFLTQTSFGVSSGEDGAYAISGIPSGDYLLAVSKVGYQQQLLPISITSGETLELNITLAEATYHLDDVAVFGQKRQTIHAIRLNAPLERTPLSVNIISKELIEQQQIINLEDALKNVSGVTKFGSYGLSDNINIRGFDIGLAGGPENYRVNGIMMRTPFSDYIEEVQVLKGPASILYGDVEPGGIINYVTKKPLGYDHASFDLKVDNFGLFRPSLDIGGRLSDKVSYRLNTVYMSSNSYRDEVFTKQFMIAPSFLWNLSEQTTVNLEGLFMNNETTIDWGMPVFMPLEEAKQLDPTNFYGYPNGTSEGSNNNVTATFSHNFSSRFRIRNVTAYSNQPRLLHDVYPIYNSTNSNVEYSFGDYRERSRTNTFSNFFDISGEVETGSVRHALQLGFDVSHLGRPVSGNFIFPITQTSPLNNPVWQDTALSSAPEINDDETPFTTRVGFNIQDMISLLDDRLNILIGGRFSSFTDGTKFSGAAQEPAGYSDEKKSKFTPRFGVTYEVTPGVTLYGSYAESFSSVAPNPGRGLTDPEPLSGDQIEFGVKQSLLNDRLGITVSYFDLNRSNVLQFDIIDPNGSISDPNNFRANQSGEHNSRGIELDINGKLLDNWQVFGAFSYFKTEVTSEISQSGNSAPIDFAGFELPNNPNSKLSLWSQYTFKNGIPGLILGAGVFHQGDMFGDRLNTVENTIEAFTRIDALAGYEYKNIRLQINVNNLNDINTFQRSIFGSYVPQPTRRVLASLKFTF